MRRPSHKQISARGGNTTLKRYGKKFYSKNGKKGAKTKLRKYGKAYYVRISKLGVEARKRNKIEREKERLTKQAVV